MTPVSNPTAAKKVIVQASNRRPAAQKRPDRQAPAPAAFSRPIFPPKDADAETRRRWLARSPWPEVVFASAF